MQANEIQGSTGATVSAIHFLVRKVSDSMLTKLDVPDRSGAQETSKIGLLIGHFGDPAISEFLACNSAAGDWSRGLVSPTSHDWLYVGNTAKLGNIWDGRPLLVADCTGNGCDDILFYSPSDANWWIGRYGLGRRLVWDVVGNTTRFGNVGDGRPIWLCDFTGSGKAALLFYYPGDKNWWLGQFTEGGTLDWSLAGNTSRFGNVGDGRPIWVGDFNGAGKASLLFYYPGDKNWWLGQFGENYELIWTLVGNTAEFGEISDGRPIWIGDFTGTGATDILFYYPGDKNWWLGQFGEHDELSWTLVDNTSGFGEISDGRPIWISDFTGRGATDVLFFYPGDQHWWLGQFTEGLLSWSLVDVTQFGNVADGRPIWIADFTGTGASDVLFYYPGDQCWWLGQFTQERKLSWTLIGKGEINTLPPSGPVTQMLMIADSCFSAPFIDEYRVDSGDFTVSLMVQARSGGSLLCGRNFSFKINSDGSLAFTQMQSTQDSICVISEQTTILGDGQCHILTAISPEHGSPVIYLDGVDVSSSSLDLGAAKLLDQPIMMGNDAANDNQYSGGIMNVGIWSEILPGNAFQNAGQALIGDLTSGLVGFWPLNSTLADLSPNANPLTLTSGTLEFMACLYCLATEGPHGAVVMEVGNQGVPDDQSSLNFLQTVFVEGSATGLVGFLTDLSGSVLFPNGVALQIQSPSGTIYKSDAIDTDTVNAVTDSTGTSLFALTVVRPEEGFWQIAICARADVSFAFRLQVLPAADHWLSGTQQLIANRAQQRRSYDLGFLELELGLMLTVAGFLLAAPTGGVSLALSALGVILTLKGLDDIFKGDSLVAAVSKIKVPAPSLSPAIAWLKSIPDDISIGQLSLPGTHDSAAIGIIDPWSTQRLSIANQLLRGIRVLDIRLKVDQQADGTYSFRTCHSNIGLKRGLHIYERFTQVLSTCVTFLKERPSEFIVMSLKIDDDIGYERRDYGPYLNVLLRYSLRDVLYDMKEAALPTLSKVRGKVYCINRVDDTNDYGVPVAIPEFAVDDILPSIRNKREYSVRVQDYYDYGLQTSDVEADKARKVEALFGTPTADVTINFASAVKMALLGVYIMDRLLDYVGRNKPTFLGWLMMDNAFAEYQTDNYGLLSMVDVIVAANTKYALYPDSFTVQPYDEL